MRVGSLLLVGLVLVGLLLVGCRGVAPDTGPKLTLSWSAVPGAEEYVIERQDGGEFREIDWVRATRTEYIDRRVQPGVEYCYQVRVRTRQGALSPPTSRECGTPRP
jgi:hypothetical protein